MPLSDRDRAALRGITFSNRAFPRGYGPLAPMNWHPATGRYIKTHESLDPLPYATAEAIRRRNENDRLDAPQARIVACPPGMKRDLRGQCVAEDEAIRELTTLAPLVYSGASARGAGINQLRAISGGAGLNPRNISMLAELINYGSPA